MGFLPMPRREPSTGLSLNSTGQHEEFNVLIRLKTLSGWSLLVGVASFITLCGLWHVCRIPTGGYDVFYGIRISDHTAKTLVVCSSSALLLSPILPLCWLTVWIVRGARDLRRGDGNFCSICGYDLRATPNRCPECGNLAEPKPSNLTT